MNLYESHKLEARQLVDGLIDTATELTGQPREVVVASVQKGVKADYSAHVAKLNGFSQFDCDERVCELRNQVGVLYFAVAYANTLMGE